jgi:Ni/Fe-hydrogenase subunit HybB-like protein
MVFAFSTFWAYLWFCQFMLIYYTNMPEETAFFARRMTSGWSVIFWGSVALGWVVPFVLLIGRGAKRNSLWLMLGAISVLIGHWADLYVLIFGAFDVSAVPGLIDTSILLAFAALFVLVVRSGLKQGSLIPLHDPYLNESIQLSNPQASLDRGSEFASGPAQPRIEIHS